jgi:hypothetical protein
MIIAAALVLACGLTANLLLRMIRDRLKYLPTVPATTIHQAAPDENGRGSFSRSHHSGSHDYAMQCRLENHEIFSQESG